MRLLADENLPLAAIRALRHAGHDVFAAAESAPGQPDAAVVARAEAEQRVILTFDRDFGTLTALGPTAVPGVIMLRIIPSSAEELGVFLTALLGRDDVRWLDHLSVVTAEHIRQRKLPRAV